MRFLEVIALLNQERGYFTDIDACNGPSPSFRLFEMTFSVKYIHLKNYDQDIKENIRTIECMDGHFLYA